jgi:acyl carrier protein
MEAIVETFDRVKAIFAESFNVDEDKITLESHVRDDLGADSLDVFEAVMGLEDEFGIEIDDTDVWRLSTVQDYVDFIKVNQ